MRQVIYSAIICLLFALAPPVQAQGGPDLDALLKGSVAAYGGQARLAALSTLRMTGQILVKGQAQPGRVERLFQLPDRLSSSIAYAGGAQERRLLVRDKAYRNGQPASVPEHLAMSLQLARLRLPLLLAENRANLKDLGEREQNGRRMRTVALGIAEGVTLTVLIDTASGFILQTVGNLSLADGTNTDFTTIYSDYRLIDGLAFALREDHYSQGIHSGTTTLNQVDVNRPLPGGAFTP